MAGGFDATGIATGVLGSVNNQFAQARKNQQEGDLAQYQAFEEASKQYQTSQNKASDLKNHIDTLAPQLRYDNDDSDSAKMASMIVARDNGTMADDEIQTRMPWLQKAYDMTKADINKNPDKYKIQASNQNTPSGDPNNIQDTNPNQTRAINKFEPAMPLSQIEAVRQNQVNRPYSSLPGGIYPAAQDFANQQNASKIQTEIPAEVSKQNALNDAKMAAETKAQQKLDQQYGLEGSVNKVGMGTPTVTNNDVAIKASDLNTDGGIHIDAPAPPEQPQDWKSSLPMDTQQRFGSVLDKNPEFVKATLNPDGTINKQKFINTLKQGDITAGNNVEGLLRGSIQINPNAFERNSTDAMGNVKPNPWQNAITMAQIADPTWSMAKFAQMQKLRNDDTGAGQGAQVIKTGNTVLQHYADLQDAANGLNNGDLNIVNKIAYSLGAQTGGTAQATYMNIANRVGEETAQFYRANGATDTAVESQGKQWAAQFSNPQQLNIIGDQAQMLQQKLGTYKAEWDNLIGPDDTSVQFLQPKTMEALQKLQPSTDAAAQTLAVGAAKGAANQQQNIPVVQSPQEAAKLPPGTTFRTPDGRTKIVPQTGR